MIVLRENTDLRFCNRLVSGGHNLAKKLKGDNIVIRNPLLFFWSRRKMNMKRWRKNGPNLCIDGGRYENLGRGVGHKWIERKIFVPVSAKNYGEGHCVFKWILPALQSLTLESGIDVGPTVINLAFFSSPYSLIKGPTFINFWNFF